MNKQFKSNQELDNFVHKFIEENFGEYKSADLFTKVARNALDWLNGSWEDYARIIINAGYDIENLRSGLCDEFLNAYDKLREQI